MSFTDSNDFPSLFIQSGGDKSQLFGINTARDARHFVLRVTGGCLVEEKYHRGLKHLEYALSGRDRSGRRRNSRAVFSGFGLFGGTRVLNANNPKSIAPGVTELLPAIIPYCSETVLLGVLAKVGHLKLSPYGLILSEDRDQGIVTIVNPVQTSCVLIQPNADMKASWDDEWKECVRICDALSGMRWQGLLLVYNGGSVTDREVRTWAKLGKRNPDFWRVLIVNGSGRIADQLANDDNFLAEYPSVYLCQNDLDDMRAKLETLGAII